MPPTRAKKIAQTMASMGFQPKFGQSEHVEYWKDYATGGARARLSCYITKQGLSEVLDQSRVARFVVTMQVPIDPIVDDVIAQAPESLQPDMLRVLEELEGLTPPIDRRQVTECDICGITLKQWVVDDEGRIHCGSPEECSVD